MLFCPKCGSILKSRKEGNKVISYCSCGYKRELKTKQIIKETIKKEEEKYITEGINPLATENHICKKCGFDKAIRIGSQIGVRETCRVCETDRPAYVCGRCGFKEFIQ